MRRVDFDFDLDCGFVFEFGFQAVGEEEVTFGLL